MTWMFVQDDVGNLEVEDPRKIGGKERLSSSILSILTIPEAYSSYSRFHRHKCKGFLADVFVLDRVSLDVSILHSLREALRLALRFLA